MSRVLVIAEAFEGKIKPSTFSTISAGLQLQSSVDVCVAAKDPALLVNQLKMKQGIQKILVVSSVDFEHSIAENYAALIKKISGSYRYILMPATTFGKNILPRVAAQLGVGQISDVVEIISENTYVRPIYAGNALAKVQNHAAIQCLTIRTTHFSSNLSEGDIDASIESVVFEMPPDLPKVTYVGLEASRSERPELTSARIVVSGGRALQNASNFKLIEKLADTLKAAVGASRAAVDAGFVPNDYQVGQTGKIVAPELYFAIGISGAIQHVAGMKDSKVIVAINKDPEAPIFQVADYGLVGDLFELIPSLQKAIEEKLG